MIAIRSSIPLAILLGVSIALSQQVQAPASVPATAPQAGVLIEEEEVMTEDLPAAVTKDSAATAAPASVPAQPVQQNVETDAAEKPAAAMDLFVGEEEEDIFSTTKVAPPGAADSAAKAAGAAAPAAKTETTAPTYEEYDRGQRYRGRYSGAMPREETPAVKSGEIVTPPAADKPADTAKPAVIEQVRSINFAKNLKEYRSPKTAMFMSLLLPGLGQAYTRRYVKAGIFGAIEIALVSATVKFAVDGSRKKKEAQSFADTRFDEQRFRTYYNDLRTHVTNTETKVLPADRDIPAEVASILEGIFYDTTEFFVSAAARSSDFYSRIQENAFAQGWDDCEPVLSGTTAEFELSRPEYTYNYIPYSADTTWRFRAISRVSGDTLDQAYYGYSANQIAYNGMIDESDRSYKWSQAIGMVLVVNHVVSAVDALISAKRHNDQLLGKHSFLHNVSLDNQFAFTGNDVITKVGMRVRF